MGADGGHLVRVKVRVGVRVRVGIRGRVRVRSGWWAPGRRWWP